MINLVILIIMLVVCLILLFANFDLLKINPFAGRVSVPSNLVERFVPNSLNLNKETNKSNPLELTNKAKAKLVPEHRNLVFTSAGDKTEFHKLWTSKNNATNNYDIMVVYYGNDDGKFNDYKKISKYIFRRKGSKFQNFHYIYNNYPNIINKYDRFFILDDDIIFGPKQISQMFTISKHYNLAICGPTFENVPECKISHRITITKKTPTLRYTNFIEVNVPLFNRVALDKLMKYYDPILIGWGIDYLYIWSCGKDKSRDYALIDSVTCINPQDDKKAGKRELHNIKGVHSRQQTWINYRNKIGIKEWKHKTYNTIKLSPEV